MQIVNPFGFFNAAGPLLSGYCIVVQGLSQVLPGPRLPDEYPLRGYIKSRSSPGSPHPHTQYHNASLRHHLLRYQQGSGHCNGPLPRRPQDRHRQPS